MLAINPGWQNLRWTRIGSNFITYFHNQIDYCQLIKYKEIFFLNLKLIIIKVKTSHLKSLNNLTYYQQYFLSSSSDEDNKSEGNEKLKLSTPIVNIHIPKVLGHT